MRLDHDFETVWTATLPSQITSLTSIPNDEAPRVFVIGTDEAELFALDVEGTLLGVMAPGALEGVVHVAAAHLDDAWH